MFSDSDFLNPFDFVESLAGLTVSTMPRLVGYAIKYEAHEIEEWHYHEVGQLLYAVSGTMRLFTQENIVLIPPTMAVWLPPGIHHRVEAVTSIDERIVFVRPDTLPVDSEKSLILAVSPLLRELILAIVRSAGTEAQGKRHAALFDLFFSEVADAPEVPLSLPMPSDKRIRAMVDEAIVNPGEISSVSSWTATASASRKTVERIFLRQTSLTPSQWLKQARLISAVVSLSQGKSVSSVAQELGYATASSFTYMFKRTLGVSPGSFSRRAATARCDSERLARTTPTH